MNALLDFLKNHGTKLIGVAQGTVALICGMTGLIPDSQMKYWLAASAILTYWRGLTNSAALAADQQAFPVVLKSVPPLAKPPETKQ